MSLSVVSNTGMAVPERKPEVAIALDGLALSINQLHDRLGVLEDRLRPACAQRPDESAQQQEAPIGLCELSTLIGNRSMEIEAACSRIERLLRNLEI